MILLYGKYIILQISYQKANAKYTELKSEIMKLSKEKKADLIKALIK